MFVVLFCGLYYGYVMWIFLGMFKCISLLICLISVFMLWFELKILLIINNLLLVFVFFIK